MTAKQKKTTLLVLAVVVSGLLFAGISVHAAGKIGEIFSKDSKQEMREDGFTSDRSFGQKLDLTVGQIDSVSDDEITITLGSLDESSLPTPPDMDSSELPDFDSDSSNRSKSSFGNSSSDLSTSADKESGDFSEPDSTSGATPNSDSSDKSSSGRSKRDGSNMPTPPDFGSGSMPDLTEDFVAGTEKITLKVSDASLVKDFKAGDIVTFKYTDNTLDEIRLLSDGPAIEDKNSQSDSGNKDNSNTRNTKEKSTVDNTKNDSDSIDSTTV